MERENHCWLTFSENKALQIVVNHNDMGSEMKKDATVVNVTQNGNGVLPQAISTKTKKKKKKRILHKGQGKH